MALLTTAAVFYRAKMDVSRVPTFCPVTLTNWHNRDFNYPFFSHKITQHILNVTVTKGQAKM